MLGEDVYTIAIYTSYKLREKGCGKDQDCYKIKNRSESIFKMSNMNSLNIIMTEKFYH
jgi:hypothetical protein